MADVWANSMACHSRATCHCAECCHLVNSLSRFQSHMHATLQGAVTWRNQCQWQGVRIPSAILKIVFRHILYFFFVFNAVLTSGGFRIVSDTLVSRSFLTLNIMVTLKCELEITQGQCGSKVWVRFPFAFYSNYGAILYRLRDFATYWSKIAKFLYPIYI